MHHKRRSRRRDKRTMLPCGCCEDIRSGKAIPRIDESEICNGKSRSKKKPRSPKERCPVNRTHEWYYEWVIQTTPLYWSRWTWMSTREYKYRIKKATCIHCWKEKRLKVHDETGNWWRSRPKALPKRKVTLY